MLQESKANDSSVDCVRMETETHFNLATYYIAMKWTSKAGGRHFILQPASPSHNQSPEIRLAEAVGRALAVESTLASLDLH
jgi:hypothetical protein